MFHQQYRYVVQTRFYRNSKPFELINHVIDHASSEYQRLDVSLSSQSVLVYLLREEKHSNTYKVSVRIRSDSANHHFILSTQKRLVSCLNDFSPTQNRYGIEKHTFCRCLNVLFHLNRSQTVVDFESWFSGKLVPWILAFSTNDYV